MRYIIIFLFLSTVLFSQIILKGLIVDSLSSQPIENVNIVVKNTGLGTATDEKGLFSLNVTVSLPRDLIVSHIGYRTKIIPVYNDDRLKISLTGNIIETETINILGERKQVYGIMELYQQNIKGKELRRKGYKDVGDMLKATQSVVFNSSGWGRGEVRVRGSKSSEVLILQDGIKLNNPFAGQANTSKIDQYNIDDMVLIKGGQTVLYGEGNFGGVILINSFVPEKSRLSFMAGGGSDNQKEIDNSIDVTVSKKYFRTRNYHTLTTRAYDGKTYNYKRNISSLNRFKILSLRTDINYLNIHNLYKQQDGSILNGERIEGFSGKVTAMKQKIDLEYGNWTSDYVNNTFGNKHFTNKEKNDTYKIIKRINYKKLDFILQYDSETITSNRSIEQLETLQETKSIYSSQSQSLANVIGYKIDDKNVRLHFDLGYRITAKETEVKSSFDSPYFNTKLNGNRIGSLRMGLGTEYLFFEHKFLLSFYQGINERTPTFLDYDLWSYGKIYIEENPPQISGYDEKAYFNNYRELSSEYMTTTEITFGMESLLNKATHTISIYKNNYTNRVLYTNQLGVLFPVNSNVPVWLNGIEIESALEPVKNLSVKGYISKIFYSDPLAFPSIPDFSGFVSLTYRIKGFSAGIDNQYLGKSYAISEVGDIIDFDRKTFTHVRLGIDGQWKKTTYSVNYNVRNVFSEDFDMTSSYYATNSSTVYYERKRTIIFCRVGYTF